MKAVGDYYVVRALFCVQALATYDDPVAPAHDWGQWKSVETPTIPLSMCPLKVVLYNPCITLFKEFR